jgi:hypothetical protein
VYQLPDLYSEEIFKAKRILEFANRFLYKIKDHNVTDLNVLREINGLCKTMGNVI